MNVHFYATLRQVVGGKTAELELPEGATVRDLLETSSRLFPALGPLIWKSEGVLGDYIKVFVNGREIRHLQMLETVLPRNCSIDIFPPVAGGSL